MALDHGEENDFLERLALSEIVILILIIIFAILGNTLVLVATWIERSLHELNQINILLLVWLSLIFWLE
jgi:hypothetical protein